MPSSSQKSSMPSNKNAEREAWIEQLEHRMIQLERLASIGELTSTTTHEFNNLLMTILNYAKMGLRHKDEATRDKALTRILDAANRGAKITSTILGLSRNRAGQMEPTNLVTLVEDSLMLLEREMMKYRIDIEKEFASSPNILASPGQIQRLLLNLITNARQAIGENGTIRIRIAPEESTQSVMLTIRDNGKGIPPDILPRIFEPFFSTKDGPDSSGKGGTGLGLAACKEIVEEHQGRIRVDSTVGKGTAFTIRFPWITTAPTQSQGR
ncbi:MAG: sensor histidine kinase [Pirellula sp.]|jgi:two-component system NtrC family sensor kinase